MVRIITTSLLLASVSLAAQERKPVPDDSARVTIAGCTKGYIFTVGSRTMERPGSVDIPEGLHLRMNGPKKMINEIKAHEGSMVEITGLMKKGQYAGGVSLGGGVRIGPGPAGGGVGSPAAGQNMIDVEGWRALPDACPSR